jgi:MFS family permease
MATTRLPRGLWCCALVQTLGLACAGWHFRHALNPDAVAYLRIASYYAEGQWGLAVSGYWGPLLSWLAVPLFKAGFPALAAGRIVMGISAVVFLWGSVAVYRAFSLPDRWVLIGAWLAAAASVYWSVQFITPDLLLGGLIGFATSRILSADWLRKDSRRIAAGALWGLAYLAKAMALPLAMLFVALAGFVRFHREHQNGRVVWRSVLLTFLVFGLVAAPWVFTLSLKYHTPTFSTAARISHTIAGPGDMDRYHPVARSFHVPEKGRITAWEDPSQMDYRVWSPFDNAEYAKHQLGVILRNVGTTLFLLTSLNCLWLWLPVEILWRLRTRGSRMALWRADWLRALALPALLGFLYLPFFVTRTEQRYFYAAFPFLFAALVLRLIDLAGQKPSISHNLLRAGALAVALGALAPLMIAVGFIGDTPGIAGECAHELAARIQRAGRSGPVAGSGKLPGGRAGLYVALLLDRPWYGDELAPTVADMKRSGARLLVVNRHGTLAAAAARDPALRDLDSELFPEASEAAGFPLKVFERR